MIGKFLQKTTAMSAIKASSIAGATHVGLVRPHNEDDFAIISLPGDRSTLVVVADGMGGHEGGEIASFFSTRELIKVWLNKKQSIENKTKETEDLIATAIRQTNLKVHEINSKLKINRAMGTTVTIGLFTPGKLTIYQVGDSRAYCTHNGEVKQITEDQTWVAKMVKLGNLSPAEAENHPLSHLLSNCLGASSHLQVEITRHKRKPGERYLFCTDGLYGSMPSQDLEEILTTGSTPKETIDKLIKSSLRGGGKDNITGIVLFEDEDSEE